MEQKIRNGEQVKIEKEGKKETENRLDTVKQARLQNCLDEISERFGNILKNEKNIVSYERAKIMIELFQKQRDECFKNYPQQRL